MKTETIIVILGIIFVLFFSGAYFLRKTQCLSAYSNYEPQFGLLSDCRIMVDGKLTPVNIVREIK